MSGGGSSGSGSSDGEQAVHAWFATPFANPNKRVAGPYQSYDEAEAACVLLHSESTTVMAFVARRVPAWYIPRQFAVRIEGASLIYAPVATPVRPPPRPKSSVTTPTVLPDVVHTYTVGQLALLCKALNINDPPANISKAHIIEHIERELGRLQGGGARKRVRK